MAKRIFDVLVAVSALILLAPLLILVALLVWVTSPGPVIFDQERIGLRGQPFRILKFRSMVNGAAGQGPSVTASNDARVTPVGAVIRKLKVDELPQLLNVLAGEMSLVGPRPEVRKYVEMFPEDYELIHSVRPGITGVASVEFANEAEILAGADDPEAEYVANVLPEKLEMERRYVENQSLFGDLRLIVATVFAILNRPENRVGTSEKGGTQ